MRAAGPPARSDHTQGCDQRLPEERLAGAGAGIGNVFGSLVLAYSKNPSLEGQLFTYAIMGFALTEAIALFGLMMAFLILYG